MHVHCQGQLLLEVSDSYAWHFMYSSACHATKKEFCVRRRMGFKPLGHGIAWAGVLLFSIVAWQNPMHV
jgi:hypothetical protein